MTDWRLANNTVKMARVIAERMPHLEFAIWDLSEFMPAFHNVRRNMIFIEGDKIALKEVMRTLAQDSKTGDCLFYLGERKPKTVNEEWASAKSVNEIRDVVVIIARKDFKDAVQIEGNIRVPSIERRVIDLLAYSLRGWLPISIEESVDALLWTLKDIRKADIPQMQRYATRRYLGWFLDIILYNRQEKAERDYRLQKPGAALRLAPVLYLSYIINGKKYLEAIKRVEAYEP